MKMLTKIKIIHEDDLTSEKNCTPIIGTHDGKFHCDEVLSCFMLKQLPQYENALIFRSRNLEALRKYCDIIVDVGDEFNHERKFYDHHQKTFQETFSSLRPDLDDKHNIKLSSAGLIYAFYGEYVIANILKEHANIALSVDNLRLCFKEIYKNFIEEIDAVDNGVQICPNNEKPLYTFHTHLSARISQLNPSWDTDQDIISIDNSFQAAINLVGDEFTNRVIYIGGSWLKAREIVRKALVTAKDIYESGEILLLEPSCPWKHHLASLEKEHGIVGLPKIVIFRNMEKCDWRVTCVPVEPDSFECRKLLPELWRGLRHAELVQAAQLDNLTFVHRKGFIGGAENKETAIAMAIKSVQWPSDV